MCRQVEGLKHGAMFGGEERLRPPAFLHKARGTQRERWTSEMRLDAISSRSNKLRPRRASDWKWTESLLTSGNASSPPNVRTMLVTVFIDLSGSGGGRSVARRV